MFSEDDIAPLDSYGLNVSNPVEKYRCRISSSFRRGVSWVPLVKSSKRGLAINAKASTSIGSRWWPRLLLRMAMAVSKSLGSLSLVMLSEYRVVSFYGLDQMFTGKISPNIS